MLIYAKCVLHLSSVNFRDKFWPSSSHHSLLPTQSDRLNDLLRSYQELLTPLFFISHVEFLVMFCLPFEGLWQNIYVALLFSHILRNIFNFVCEGEIIFFFFGKMIGTRPSLCTSLYHCWCGIDILIISHTFFFFFGSFKHAFVHLLPTTTIALPQPSPLPHTTTVKIWNSLRQ